ncbi:MAG: sulfatase [Acidobacteriia bacterium]|nr:sulfatase [Terriglobia bacterium]
MERLTRRSLLAAPAALPAVARPQASQEKLNLIHIGVDTWGAHHTGYYGHGEYRTPNVDQLLGQSAVFLEAYPQALPTIPSRRVIYTGRQVFPSEKIYQPDDQVKIRGWHQMFSEDVTLSETLQQAGYTTAIVSDLYHQFKPGKNFTRGFDSWQWIRGQESDRYRTGGRRRIDLSQWMHASQPVAKPAKPTGVFQYLLNRQDWKSEKDWLASQVFDTAGAWLGDNAGENQPFYLHIESFSPHEFWDPPEDYYRAYMKQDYRGPRLIHPPATTHQMSAIEVAHARALYAGLVTFTDACIGRFLEKVRQLGLLQNTLIVFAADHGTMMGEQGQLHKGETRLRDQVTRVPLGIRHPKENWAGRKIAGYAQHTDLMPTVLELLGQKAPPRVTGRSLVKALSSNERIPGDAIVTGWGEHAAIRAPDWTYIARWSPGPAFEELYDRRRDALELTNAAAANPKVCAAFRAMLKQYVDKGWETTRGSFAVHAS